MSRVTICIAGWLCLGLPGVWPCASAFGQATTDVPRLITTLRWVEVHLSGGRIRATSTYTGRRITASNKGSSRSEELSVDVSGGAVTLDYRLAADDSRLSIAITGGDEVYIRFAKSDDDAVAVEFLQPASGEVVLMVPEDGEAVEYEAPSIWHLLLAEPELCRRELLPLFGPLRPDWRLMEESQQVESELLKLAQTTEPPDYQSWSAWVAELGREEFSRRRNADQSLRSAGRAVLPYLRGLDRHHLDAEQRRRVRQIVAALGGVAGFDTPESVAAWLASDPRTWLIMLASEDEARRRLALAQLSHAWGEEVDFDPQADLPTREAQLAKLRLRVE